MGCFKIGGRVVGATDGPSVDAPACYRNKRDRVRLGCDGPMPDAISANVDSAFAARVLATLAAKLEPDEMGRVLAILQEADLIDKDEARAVSEALRPDDVAGAADKKMFPHADRLKPAEGIARLVIDRPRQLASPEYRAMFPNSGRLK